MVITNLTRDNYGSAFSCRTGYKCIDVVEKSIRVMGMRFETGIEATQRITDANILFKANLPHLMELWK